MRTIDRVGDKEYVLTEYGEEPCQICEVGTKYRVLDREDMSETPCCTKCWRRVKMAVDMAVEEYGRLITKRRISIMIIGMIVGALLVEVIKRLP